MISTPIGPNAASHRSRRATRELLVPTHRQTIHSERKSLRTRTNLLIAGRGKTTDWNMSYRAASTRTTPARTSSQPGIDIR